MASSLTCFILTERRKDLFEHFSLQVETSLQAIKDQHQVKMSTLIRMGRLSYLALYFRFFLSNLGNRIQKAPDDFIGMRIISREISSGYFIEHFSSTKISVLKQFCENSDFTILSARIWKVGLFFVELAALRLILEPKSIWIKKLRFHRVFSWYASKELDSFRTTCRMDTRRIWICACHKFYRLAV